jgi:two-component system, OmpR family, sensor histidine kinase CiaH
MTMAHVPAVRRQSIRVALAATGFVALAYLLVSVAVVLFVTANLTAQVDQRLVESFQRLPPDGIAHDQPPDPGRDPGRPFGAPFLVWTVLPNGAVVTAASTPDLPPDLHAVIGPVTATIAGTEFRVAGEQVGDITVVMAQSMEQVTDARTTIILGELLIAPFLLGIVFLGAVVIGRRVAAPIEAARQRQLEFTADASHELRTPLSVIEANTSLALTQDRDAGWYRTAFERVDRESRRMRRLLEDMLWLARFDAAREPRSTEPVELGVLAAQASDRFAAVAEARHLTLAVHPAAGPAVIAAAPDLVDRLIGALLDNACKYAPDGGVVDVTVALDGNRTSVTVDDSGPGIPAVDRDRIFDRFHRATTTANEVGGAGLGLAIGDAIVRATGGRWSIGSSPAGGARVTVSWPRATLN